MDAKLRTAIQSELAAERFDETPDGLLLPRLSALARGVFFDRTNGGEWEATRNLIVTEGLAHILSVALGQTAKPAGYYLALFSGTASPAANWTAASFAATANEITSQTEGYTAATRPVWTPPASTATGSIDNMASVASVTIATEIGRASCRERV